MSFDLTPQRDCPTITAALAAHTAARDLAAQLRTLRRLATRCPACELAPKCPQIDEYNAAITDALTTIATEYGLM